MGFLIPVDNDTNELAVMLYSQLSSVKSSAEKDFLQTSRWRILSYARSSRALEAMAVSDSEIGDSCTAAGHVAMPPSSCRKNEFQIRCLNLLCSGNPAMPTAENNSFPVCHRSGLSIPRVVNTYSVEV